MEKYHYGTQELRKKKQDEGDTEGSERDDLP
jgi:hypothetical protein